tara:strand:- start:1350 stop:1739 length:390 start_codon:yes stop_codon:yes gene_type:complete
MKPHQLIGLPYRLGADPLKHNAVDCLSLARTVLKHYGIKSPEPTRDWYRRFRKKDYKIFKEELEKWGNETKQFNIGTVALCKSKNGFGLAVYYEEGWINCGESGVRWSPLDGLEVVESYFPQKSNYVKQ